MSTTTSHELRKQAVLLKEAGMSVEAEEKPRLLQHSPNYFCSLNATWLRRLNINNQSEPINHFLITGMEPIIITEPSIVLQPCNLGDTK